MNLEMRDEGKKRRRSTAIPESSQDLPSEKKIKGKWVQRKGLRWFTWPRTEEIQIKTSDEIKEPEEKCVMEEEHKEQTNITMEVQEPVISENERRKRLREILRLVAQKLRQKELVNFVLRKVSYVT